MYVTSNLFLSGALKTAVNPGSLSKTLLASGVVAAALLAAPVAHSTVLLTFGQTATGDTVTASRVGSTTTITSDTTVDITDIDAIVVHPVFAAFTLTATNTGPATMVGSDIEQHYSGTFTITSGATNYLSGTFSDAIFGSGGALAITVSNATPGESVTFSSNVIAPGIINAFDRSAALSFTDVSPPARIVLGTLRSFTSDVSGDFSATVPEASTWAMMLLGFGGLGYAAYRRAKADRATLFG
jgi:hypothetical protein